MQRRETKAEQFAREDAAMVARWAQTPRGARKLNVIDQWAARHKMTASEAHHKPTAPGATGPCTTANTLASIAHVAGNA